MKNPAIVLTCDDRYARHAAVTIISAISNSDKNFDFYIVDCGISSENIDRLKAIDALNSESSLSIIKAPKNEIFENFPMAQWFSPSIFYRVCIPDLLKDRDCALYIDSDIVVDGDIGEIFEHNVDHHLFGAVYLDDNFIKGTQFAAYKSKLGIPSTDKYFYSGLMLMNLKSMRAENVFENVLQFLKNNPDAKLLCPEQDILNVIISRSRIFELSPKYNFSPFSPLAKETAKRMKPVCLHFSVYKPWEFPEKIVSIFGFTYVFRYANFYHKYAQKTPWKSIKHSEASVYKAIKAIYKSFMQPIERFFRFEVRNRLKRLISNK